MCEKARQGTKVEEKVLVPVRRREAAREAEQEIREEPRAGKQRETQRRWYVY